MCVEHMCTWWRTKSNQKIICTDASLPLKRTTQRIPHKRKTANNKNIIFCVVWVPSMSISLRCFGVSLENCIDVSCCCCRCDRTRTSRTNRKTRKMLSAETRMLRHVLQNVQIAIEEPDWEMMGRWLSSVSCVMCVCRCAVCIRCLFRWWIK